MKNIDRRRFLAGLLAAPAIVPAASLYIPPRRLVFPLELPSTITPNLLAAHRALQDGMREIYFSKPGLLSHLIESGLIEITPVTASEVYRDATS